MPGRSTSKVTQSSIIRNRILHAALLTAVIWAVERVVKFLIKLLSPIFVSVVTVVASFVVPLGWITLIVFAAGSFLIIVGLTFQELLNRRNARLLAANYGFDHEPRLSLPQTRALADILQKVHTYSIAGSVEVADNQYSRQSLADINDRLHLAYSALGPPGAGDDR